MSFYFFPLCALPTYSLPPHLLGPYLSSFVPQQSAARGGGTMLGGSLVTTAWRVLRLRMEEKASRYGG